MTLDKQIAKYHAHYLLHSLAPSLHEMGMVETARDVREAAEYINMLLDQVGVVVIRKE